MPKLDRTWTRRCGNSRSIRELFRIKEQLESQLVHARQPASLRSKLAAFAAEREGTNFRTLRTCDGTGCAARKVQEHVHWLTFKQASNLPAETRTEWR